MYLCNVFRMSISQEMAEGGLLWHYTNSLGGGGRETQFSNIWETSWWKVLSQAGASWDGGPGIYWEQAVFGNCVLNYDSIWAIIVHIYSHITPVSQGNTTLTMQQKDWGHAYAASIPCGTVMSWYMLPCSRWVSWTGNGIAVLELCSRQAN